MNLRTLGRQAKKAVKKGFKAGKQALKGNFKGAKRTLKGWGTTH